MGRMDPDDASNNSTLHKLSNDVSWRFPSWVEKIENEKQSKDTVRYLGTYLWYLKVPYLWIAFQLKNWGNL